MFGEDGQSQVNDRFFSVVGAEDAARGLWDLLSTTGINGQVMHFGSIEKWSRYKLVKHGLGNPVTAVGADFFPIAAPRPIDTTWESSNGADTSGFTVMLNSLIQRGSMENMDHERRSAEINIIPWGTAGKKRETDLAKDFIITRSRSERLQRVRCQRK